MLSYKFLAKNIAAGIYARFRSAKKYARSEEFIRKFDWFIQLFRNISLVRYICSLIVIGQYICSKSRNQVTLCYAVTKFACAGENVVFSFFFVYFINILCI